MTGGKECDRSSIARELYEKRFGERERSQKATVWRVLCRSFFQRYVRPTDTVLDIGAGYCEFINNIVCQRKYAVDISQETRTFAGPGVEVLVRPANDLSCFAAESIDVVFASNLLEHLPSREELLRTLAEFYRVLRPGGKLLVLQSNIRYTLKEFWDYFDHYLPLSHLSLSEALRISGFVVEEVRPRFLPYTFKSRLPKWPPLVWLYLRLPVLHLLLGKQMFVVAVRPGEESGPT